MCVRDCHISHVIFDLDGLLISTEEIYTEFISKFLAQYGKEYTYEVKRKMMGRKSAEAAAIMVNDYNLPLTVEELIIKLHENLTPEIWHKANLLPGAADIVSYFHLHGLPMAIASGSSSSDITAKTFNNREIWSKFHHFVASGDDPEIKLGKPAPDIFLVALKRFDDPTADCFRTLVFEDAWNGVAAAVAAGMHVVWVPDPRESPGIPDSSLTDEQKSLITRISNLNQFNPADFMLPPRT